MNTIIDELRKIQTQENYQDIEACIEIVKKYKDIYMKGLAYDQVSWERNLAIEQLTELGGELGEKTELIKKRIIENQGR